LKEAEYWRVVSRAMGNKSYKMGIIQRIMTEVVKPRIERPFVSSPQFQALRKFITMKLISTH
jgi:hypothetical protein